MNLMAQDSLFEFAAEPKTPGDLLRALLEERGWTQDELGFIAGASRQTIAQIIANRSGITPDMAVSFAAAFGNSASDWLRLDAEYRLSQVKKDPQAIEQRARVYSVAPVREMQRRGWINETKDVAEIEAELRRFFGADTLDTIPPVSVAPRKSSAADFALTSIQRAWCYRAREIAKALQVVPFKWSDASLAGLRNKLRELAAYTKEARHLPKLFSEYGIRFVIIEPLPGGKIDGAAFWLDEHSPVIALSVRYDRIDNFWFTVMHEFSHIKNGDSFSLDLDLESEEEVQEIPHEFAASEQRANIEASGVLIGKSELDSFIARVAPLFSKDRIVQFAHSVKIHPGIVVGQLKYRGELRPGAYRELVSRIRDVITETALTDGWGKSIAQAVL